MLKTRNYSKITNLSKHEIKEPELALLNKGLKFAPPVPLNISSYKNLSCDCEVALLNESPGIKHRLADIISNHIRTTRTSSRISSFNNLQSSIKNIRKAIFSSPKDKVGVILTGSEDSNNFLFDGDAYGNINISIPLRESNWDAVRKLEKECYATSITTDWTEAVIVALNCFRKDTEVKKFNEKRIVLFTCNFRTVSSENISLIEDEMKELTAELIVIVPKFEEKPEEESVKKIVEKVNGTIYDLDSAIPQLMSFQKKKVLPQAWNVCLDIGSKIKIPVTGRKKINSNQMPPWNTCLESDRINPRNAIKGKESNPSDVTQSQSDVNQIGSSHIDREVIYYRKDQTVVQKDELVHGYCYGSTLIPFSDGDKQELNYESGPKCLSLLKITKKEFVPRHIWLGKSGTCFVARENDEHATLAFSAFVQALERLKSVAIVRRIYNNGYRPYLGALIPCVKPRKEYLLYVELPFAHDLRQCIVPKLEVGNLKEEQINAIDRLIDGMDLSEQVDTERPEDYVEDKIWGDFFKPQEISSPYYQYVRRCIAHRALNPGRPLPDLDPDIIKPICEPPQHLKDTTSDCIKEISILFPNLIPVKTGEKRNISKDSVDAKENEPLKDEEGIPNKRIKNEDSENIPEYVGILTPLEDFKAAIDRKDVSYAQVCSQMQDVILNLVLNAFGKEDFEKPKNSLKVLRNSIIANNTDKKSDFLLSFNKWMEQLYSKLQENFKMGFWQLVIEGKLGFISRDECPESTLTSDDVKKMLLPDESLNSQIDFEDEDMDVGDLLDDL